MFFAVTVELVLRDSNQSNRVSTACREELHKCSKQASFNVHLFAVFDTRWNISWSFKINIENICVTGTYLSTELGTFWSCNLCYLTSAYCRRLNFSYYIQPNIHWSRHTLLNTTLWWAKCRAFATDLIARKCENLLSRLKFINKILNQSPRIPTLSYLGALAISYKIFHFQLIN